MITTKKINNEQIKIIPVSKTNPNDIKGYNIIPALHTNIFICAHKGSGKTNIEYKIIESCIDTDTKVIVFCSTHNNDEAWKYIKKYFEKNKIQAMFYSSLIENGINQLENLMEYLRQEGEANVIEEQSKKKDAEYIQIVKFDNKKAAKIKIKKKRKETPKYLIIFDDLSAELKKRDVPYLLQTFRHYQAKVIVSTQYLTDIEPKARSQFDFWILLKNHIEEKLKKVFPEMGCNIEFDYFYKIYKEVTSQPYHFLFINKINCTFRNNFTHEIEIKKNMN